MSGKKGLGTSHCATWRRWGSREWGDARSADTDGRRGEGTGRNRKEQEGTGRDAKTGGWWGEDEESWREGRGEKERGYAPRVEGHEREIGVEEAFCGGPERVGEEPEVRPDRFDNLFFSKSWHVPSLPQQFWKFHFSEIRDVRSPSNQAWKLTFLKCRYVPLPSQ